MPSISHTEFIKKIHKLQPQLKVLSEYINMKTKVVVEDELGIEYACFPEALLKGAKPKITSALDLNSAFKQKLKAISPGLEVCTKYESANEKIIVKDHLNIKYSLTPASLLTGNIPSIKTAIDQTDAIKKMIYSKRNDCTIISEYAGDKAKLIVKDLDGIYYEMIPYNLLKGNLLTLKAAKDKTDYIRTKIFKIHPKLKLVSRYKSPFHPLIIEDEFGIQYKSLFNNILKATNPTNLKSAIHKEKAIVQLINNLRPDVKYKKDSYSKATEKIKVFDKYGIEHEMSIYGLLDGNQLGFLSAVNKDEYFDYLYKKQTSSNYIRVGNYQGNGNTIEMNCRKHGNFNTTPYALLRGAKCPICNKLDRLNSIQEFIKKANTIHNGHYDYSVSQYHGYNSRINIICPYHGEFNQSVKGHLSGKGCRKCADENLSGTLSNLVEIEPNTPYILYNLILWSDDMSEVFGKTGLTLNIKQRFYGLPYNYKVISFQKGLIKDLYRQEQEIVNQMKKQSRTYRPKIKFKGHTECFKLTNQELNSFLQIGEKNNYPI